jgi:hypothetical protein
MELNGQVLFQAATAANQSLLQTIAQLPADSGTEDGIPPGGVVPAQIVRFLAQLRLLEGVPFSYLVPDAELIPVETIRFFYLDRNATDALVQGALSVGTVNSADRVQLAQLYQTVRDEVDEAERLIGAGGPVTGFLLRSRLVSGWPGMHVRAYSTDTIPDDQTIPDMDTSPDRVRVLRMERLAPAVLLVLFDGVPAVVHIEEPRGGIQFGVRLKAGADPSSQSAVLAVRDVQHPNNGPLPGGGAPPRTVPVPFRPGSPGVIDMKRLNDSLLAIPQANMGATIDSAEFALQMLRFPLRQVFGDTANIPPGTDAFVATVKIGTLTERFALARQVLGG